MATVFILYILGFDLKTIKNDYLLTNELVKPELNKKIQMAKDEGVSRTALHNIKILFSVNIDFLNGALNAIDDNYGDMEWFIKNGLKISSIEQKE